LINFVPTPAAIWSTPLGCLVLMLYNGPDIALFDLQHKKAGLIYVRYG